jgi:hypothetical protein
MIDRDNKRDTEIPAQVAPAASSPAASGRLSNGRFEKGFTGNAKGRPKKPERAWSRRQQAVDVLREANRLIPIQVHGKAEFITVRQLIYRNLLSLAAKGDAKAAKIALEKIDRAQLDHENRNHATFSFLEICELQADNPPMGLSKEEFQEDINEWRRRSRR